MPTILVISKDLETRARVAGALAAANYRVLEAATPTEAVSLAAVDAPDAIVSPAGEATRPNGPLAGVPLVRYPDSTAHSNGIGFEAGRLLGAVAVALTEPGEDPGSPRGMPSRLLRAAIQSMDDGLALYDAEDRLIIANRRLHEFFPAVAAAFVPGTTFGEILRVALERAAIRIPPERSADWAAARVSARRASGETVEIQIADGRWLRRTERPTEDGGRVSIFADITALKTRETALRDSEARFQRLNEIGIALSAEKSRDRLLEMILAEAMRITHADGGTVYLRREGKDEPAPAATGGEAVITSADLRHVDAATLKRTRPESPEERRLSARLRFEILRTDSLGIAMGGTTGVAIPFADIHLYDRASGAPNHHNVATHAALTGGAVNIKDAYNAEGFDFSGTRAFDQRNSYRSTSFLTVPMKDNSGAVIGVLQLLNARDADSGRVIPFAPHLQPIIESLASQAAVAIENQALVQGQKALLESFIKLIAAAIDAKSPYTGGHCTRVPTLTDMLAAAADRASDGAFAAFRMTEEERYALHIAGWLHDCGKVTTPEYVIDKATKLETIHDRIELVRVRFEVLKREAELRALRAGTGAATLREELAAIDDDLRFLEVANIGGEFMSPAHVERVKRIALRRWTDPSGESVPVLSDEEVYNLTIPRGTLTAEEREIINGHMVMTIEMLERLPFPKHLRQVPEYAGGHHEKMDGTGYPRGLRRDEMSVPARMMAVADIFEALTAADRPYKKAKTLSESIAIMAKMKQGDHIDPDVFDLFLTSGVYRDYAEKFLLPEQIDAVDVTTYLG